MTTKAEKRRHRENDWARKERVISLDGLTLASINIGWLKAKAGAELMDTITLCADGCGRPWTTDIVRHQKALLRGATPDVLICNVCFKAIQILPLEEGIPQSWEHVHYTRPEVDQAEAVITWHGDLIRSYAVQAASEKITRLANETITMLREKREKVIKEDGSIAARAVIARMGKAELRTDATKREQVIDLLVTHRHLIPVARKGHYMMMVPHV